MRYLIGAEGKQRFLKEPAGTPIVVDVLRASSTIVAALWAGAKEIIPIEDANEALALGKKMNAVLVGERNGVKLDGFEYNNSPSEMLAADLKGRTIVMTTSNGVKVMVDGGIVGSTLNAGAVAEHVMSIDRTYLLASNPLRSIEDLNAASIIEVMALMLGSGWFTYEAERYVQDNAQCQELLDGIRDSPAGERIARLGHEDDVEMVCTAINRFPIVPVYRNGSIAIEKWPSPGC
ncbi:2-phosphosulfolactate phosphatase [Methanocella conradii]|uniref:2-phosphosulfolactate phosphatase n=1 Tax=Methanocella conradii TaxID=1175444 RepID=UPI0024B3A6AC|nr:2-phosphosulfolactate phosphatase [Methanocella conradii]MDI6897137.1 2-phosphosulfolactate phosphatase [Methanocella conradii]